MAASWGLTMRIAKAMNKSSAPRIEQVFHNLSRGTFLQLDASRGLTAPLESQQLPIIKSCLAQNTLVGVQFIDRFEPKCCLKDRLRVSRRKSVVLNVCVWLSRCIIISLNLHKNFCSPALYL